MLKFNNKTAAAVLALFPCLFILFCAEKLSAGEPFPSRMDINMSAAYQGSPSSDGVLLAAASNFNINRSGRYVKYEVQRGDSLFRISMRYGVPVEEIIRVNNLKGDMIQAGQIIRVPEMRGSGGSQHGRSSDPVIQSNEKPVFRWPVPRVHGYKRDGLDGVNSIGIIINCPSGERVVSAASGIVEKVGYMRGFGNYIIIRHSSGFSTVYSNIGRITVREGERIAIGRTIGYVSEQRRVHFQIDRGGQPEDPLSYLPR